MKKYKLFLQLFLILFLVSNLFADIKNNVEQKENDNNVAYLGIEKESSKKNGIFSIKKDLNNKKSIQYNITGSENKFNLTDKELKNVYDIDDKEIAKYSRKLFLTKFQQAQIDYLEMERKSKISALDKEISSREKMLDEELANDFSDAFLIDALTKEIKALVVDKVTVNINIDKKIRYVLDSQQYLKYKQKQNKKSKKY